MNTLLAVDPGTTQSAWVLYTFNVPRAWAKEPNEDVLRRIAELDNPTHFAIESVASYGMAVGAEVFETCVWAGRFIQAWTHTHDTEPIRVYRRDVKLHLCGSSRAKDANVRQALIDIYGPGKDKAIGKKATPGPLYGMKADCWAALGVAVTAVDTRHEAVA